MSIEYEHLIERFRKNRRISFFWKMHLSLKSRHYIRTRYLRKLSNSAPIGFFKATLQTNFAYLTKLYLTIIDLIERSPNKYMPMFWKISSDRPPT